MLMLDGRKEGDVNTPKQNGSKRVAVKSAAQEAADDVRAKHYAEDHHVTKGGGTPQTPTKPVFKPFLNRSDPGSWCCKVCTYLNSTGNFCGMCTAERRQWENKFTSPDCFRVKKKSISSSMKRMWWRKRGKRSR